MFSTSRSISIFSIILSVINVLGVITLTSMLLTFDLGFAIEFCIAMYLVTSTLGILLVTLSLRSMCQDLILNHESTSKKLRELEIRCKNIENKIN